jgi:hypothetical protein
MPKCWAAGFHWLSGKHAITNNLRALDRQRERQINRVVRRLKGLDLPTAEAQPKRKRYGFPFSYVGQFQPSAQKGSSRAE